MIASNIDRTIRELRRELARLEGTIASLEALARAPATPEKREKRGRKAMGAEERTAVSERIKKYWASRRAARMTA